MSDEKLKQLKLEYALKTIVDYGSSLAAKAAHDHKLEDEIAILRKHVTFFDIKRGYFMCEGPYGRAIAEQKEATLYNSKTRAPLKFARFNKHLHAKHRALVWVVLGYADNKDD